MVELPLSREKGVEVLPKKKGVLEVQVTAVDSLERLWNVRPTEEAGRMPVHL
jgi:hypothetical protein